VQRGDSAHQERGGWHLSLHHQLRRPYCSPRRGGGGRGGQQQAQQVWVTFLLLRHKVARVTLTLTVFGVLCSWPGEAVLPAVIPDGVLPGPEPPVDGIPDPTQWRHHWGGRRRGGQAGGATVRNTNMAGGVLTSSLMSTLGVVRWAVAASCALSGAVPVHVLPDSRQWVSYICAWICQPEFPALEAGRGSSRCNELEPPLEVLARTFTLYLYFWRVAVWMSTGKSSPKFSESCPFLHHPHYAAAVSPLTHKLSAEHGAMPSAWAPGIVAAVRQTLWAPWGPGHGAGTRVFTPREARILCRS